MNNLTISEGVTGNFHGGVERFPKGVGPRQQVLPKRVEKNWKFQRMFGKFS
jgi:hypothetical protein